MNDQPRNRTVDVAVVGGGPAGLTAARVLAQNTPHSVVVLDREAHAGGIPRHSDHLGYGIRDKHRFTTGPAYARRLTAEALDAGAEILTHTMATGWSGQRSLWLTSPDGRTVLTASVVLLATGARERPRSARMIPGGRPSGVYTTGELQNAVHLHRQPVGMRAVVLGAAPVSWSAVMTLKEAGCDTALMVTDHRRPESYGIFTVAGRIALRTPIATHHRIIRILGRHRVEGVEIEDASSGLRRIVDCDTVVTTADWIPDHELARSAGVVMDSGTCGPLVDAVGRTSLPHLFAAGNVVHPVDTADVAAIGGAHVARAIKLRLAGELLEDDDQIPLIAKHGFAWITPGLVRPGHQQPARRQLQTWVTGLVRRPSITVRQDQRVLTRRTIPWPASPGRVFRVPWTLLDTADPRGGPIELSL